MKIKLNYAQIDKVLISTLKKEIIELSNRLAGVLPGTTMTSADYFYEWNLREACITLLKYYMVEDAVDKWFKKNDIW